MSLCPDCLEIECICAELWRQEIDEDDSGWIDARELVNTNDGAATWRVTSLKARTVRGVKLDDTELFRFEAPLFVIPGEDVTFRWTDSASARFFFEMLEKNTPWVYSEAATTIKTKT